MHMDTHSADYRYGDLLAMTNHFRNEARNIILTGATGFLGSNFLFWKLRQPGKVYVLVRGESIAHARQRVYDALAVCAVGYNQPVPKADIDSKVDYILGDMTETLCAISKSDLEKLAAAGISEFWHCAASLKFEDRHKEEIYHHNINGTHNVMDLAHRIHCPTYLHISTAYTSGHMAGDIPETLHPLDISYNNFYESSKNAAEHEVVKYCDAQGIDYRILRPAIIMGPLASRRSGGTRFGVYGLTQEMYRLRDTLSQLKTPMRLIGDMAAVGNLVPVDQCVFDMLYLSNTGFGEHKVYHLSNSSDLNIKAMLEKIDVALGMKSLNFVSERDTPASAIEELFDKRTVFYGGYYRTIKRFARSLPAQTGVSWSDYGTYLTAFIKELDEEKSGETFTRTQVTAADGIELCVSTFGDSGKPALVLANAYGMPSDFMFPLAKRLADQFRVITWDSRWVPAITHEFDLAKCHSLTHASDLIAILDHFGIASAPVAGWSSGAQVSLRAMAEFPDRIQCGILLNGGVSIPASGDIKITEFEKNIRTLFPKIAANYRFAQKYCDLIYGAHATADDGEDRKMISAILTSTDPFLLYMTSVPFRTPEALFRYANMMNGLFNERGDAWTADVKQPVLVHVGGKDQVTHADVGRFLVEGLQNGKLSLDEDGDHFSHFYDEDVATMIKQFVAQHQPQAQVAQPSSLANP
ncbi:alpha/beta fold hydrolase [Massilia atriviolacea]|uniref:Alpha/beta fold hydrolase n=2 Tax=Massilia atriviolacea TaxID=2495579 RepID=A0A430HU49_9BURK|nr:alpha/beta fold hydrolase [Massilia atriviolacea]